MKPINKILVFAVFAIAIAGCKKSFLDRPSNSQISSNNFYQSNADLRLATASLYGGAHWFLFQKESMLPLGDILSGNATFPWAGDIVQLYTRTITAQNGIISNGWGGLYNVVAQCNTVITDIKNAGPAISTADKNAAMAEARFIRAVAYYHLAVYWGAVPIIEDNTKLLASPLLNRNITSDVYKFVANDLTYASQNLPKTDQTGRVTTWSAQGMLGKVYLTMSGLGKSGGTRDQALLDSAKKYAGNVCKNSGLALLPNYYNLFKAQFNDNPESLFALQWAAGVGYGSGNTWSTYSPSNDINPQKNGAWVPLSPNYGLYQLYTDDDTVRLKASIMLTGVRYPELNAAGGGYTATGVSMKKHIIGNEKDNNAPTMDLWSSPEHNSVLRLADVYLIYAEAILGNNATTANGDALYYFNEVRKRAGIDPVTSLTFDDILKERRVELAFEGQYWIDLVRLSYYNPSKAVSTLNSQKRITFTYDFATKVATPDTTTITPTLPATINSFTLPIPASEMTADPKLANPPVPYY